MRVKLVAKVKLCPSPERRDALLATMRRINEACDWLAERAFEIRSADKIKLQKLHYAELRSRFGLSSQMAVRAISKVCEVYKRDKTKCPRFKPLGAVAYDQRIYTFKNGLDRVSLATLNGRVEVPSVVAAYYQGTLQGARGQADLVYRDGSLYLYVTCEVPDGMPIDVEGWIGVDLGIRNIASDSDGEHHSGAKVSAVRRRISHFRSKLQARGTRSAKKHLRKLRRREQRFATHENHRISKALVAKAKDTARGIGLEDLSGIRERVTVRKAQRRERHSWSFFQLRSHIEYKAKLAGVPVRLVDPRYTSQTCPACGTVDRANRVSQAVFRCTGCGFAAHADTVGAVNIAARAAVNRPIVPNVSDGSRPRKGQTGMPSHVRRKLVPIGVGHCGASAPQSSSL